MPITDDQKQRIIELHGQGLARNEIARKVGVSAGTVTNICKANELTFDRSSTKNATHAKVADNKARRANIIGRLYKQAEDVLTRLEAPTFSTLVPTAPGIQSARDLEFIPPGDHRNLVTAIAVVLDKALLLEKTDTDTSGTAAVDKWLEYMTSAPLPNSGGAASTPSHSPESPS